MKPGIVFILFISFFLAGCQFIDQFVQPQKSVVKYIVLPKEESGGSPTQIEASTTAAAQEAPLLVPTLTQSSDAQGGTPSTAGESATPAPAATANPVVNQPANSVQNNQQAANIQPTAIPYNPPSAPQQVDNPPSAPQQVDIATSIPNPTSMPNPTSVPNPTNIPNPTAEPTMTPLSLPPGIKAAALTQKLTSYKDNFVCSPRSIKGGFNADICEYNILKDTIPIKYHVESYSKNDNENVTFIYANVSQGSPGTETAVEVLGYVAALPFSLNTTNATQASNWVKDTLPGIQNKMYQAKNMIDGVQYTLYGSPNNPNNWFLEIGDSTF